MVERNYPALRETVWHTVLPNGLNVYVDTRPEYGKQFAFFAARYGGMDLRFRGEDGEWVDTPQGVAHFLEHKMFDTQDGNALQRMAAQGVDPNAYTTPSMTGYYFEGVQGFEDNLRTLLSFVSQPWFTEESVAKEQGIIGQEIRMCEDDPSHEVYYQLMEAMYARHPVRVRVAGTVESIAQITADTLYQCHRAFYRPGNMVLCAAGDIDPERVAAEAEAILPGEAGEAVARDYGGQEGRTPAQRERWETMEVSMPMFLAGFKCLPQEQGEARLRQSIAGAMACDALFGESSPLYTRLYEEGAINGSLGGNLDQVPGAAYLFVGGDAKDPAYVTGEIVRQAERLAREGIGEAFYQQIRRSAYGSMIRGLNSFEGIAIGMTNGRFGGYDYYRFPEVFDAITKADVEAFLRENVTGDCAALSAIRPGA